MIVAYSAVIETYIITDIINTAECQKLGEEEVEEKSVVWKECDPVK